MVKDEVSVCKVQAAFSVKKKISNLTILEEIAGFLLIHKITACPSALGVC